jgi:hypothetical protein
MPLESVTPAVVADGVVTVPGPEPAGGDGDGLVEGVVAAGKILLLFSKLEIIKPIIPIPATVVSVSSPILIFIILNTVKPPWYWCF